MDRRRFLRAAAVLGAATLARPLGTQVQQGNLPGATMGGEGYIPVRREPKPGATPSMTPDERDALERRIACPCPCTLDIFTCRTSMPCGFSPNMHRDVVSLVEGGYTAEEILAAFEEAYGEQVLMAPPRRGFNLVGYLAPFAAIGAGAVAVVALLRRWRSQAPATPTPAAGAPLDVDATPEELARLEAAVRREDP